MPAHEVLPLTRYIFEAKIYQVSHMGQKGQKMFISIKGA